MKLRNTAVVNYESNVLDHEVESAVCAVNRQIQEDFMPIWGHGRIAKPYSVKFKPNDAGAHDNEAQDIDAVIYLVDAASIPNALQWCWMGEANKPARFVYADTDAWSVPLSHEILELIVNPRADLHVHGPDPRASTVFDTWLWHAYEVCDAVERTTYLIDDIEVSNFVTPQYFATDSTSGTGTDFVGTRVRPFGVLPGCHLSIINPLSGECEVIQSSCGEYRLTIDSQSYFHQFQRPEEQELPIHSTDTQIAKIISTISGNPPKDRRRTDPTAVTPAQHAESPPFSAALAS